MFAVILIYYSVMAIITGKMAFTVTYDGFNLGWAIFISLFAAAILPILLALLLIVTLLPIIIPCATAIYI